MLWQAALHRQEQGCACWSPLCVSGTEAVLRACCLLCGVLVTGKSKGVPAALRLLGAPGGWPQPPRVARNPQASRQGRVGQCVLGKDRMAVGCRALFGPSDV